MREIILMGLLLALPIVQIVMLVTGIKRKNLGFSALAVDILSIVIACSTWAYYDSLPGYGFFPGLTYLGEVLMCMGAVAFYFLITVITVCVKAVQFERSRKAQGKRRVNPIVLIASFLLLLAGLLSLSAEIYDNRDIIKAEGTVVGFTEEKYRYFENGEASEKSEEQPLISFVVDGQTYEDSIFPGYFDSEKKVGDKVTVYCRSYISDRYSITVPEDLMFIYLPSLIIGALLLLYRIIRMKQSPSDTAAPAEELSQASTQSSIESKPEATV